MFNVCEQRFDVLTLQGNLPTGYRTMSAGFSVMGNELLNDLTGMLTRRFGAQRDVQSVPVLSKAKRGMGVLQADEDICHFSRKVGLRHHSKTSYDHLPKQAGCM